MEWPAQLSLIPPHGGHRVPEMLTPLEHTGIAMEHDGAVNDKYRARLTRRNWYAHVQAPYFEHTVEFLNAKIKSHYVRYFDLTSINIHLLENAPALLQSERITSEAVEPLLAQVEACIRNARSEFDAQIQKFGRLAESRGVSVSAKYFQEPLRVTVRIVSPICIEYLEAIQQGDQFLLVLENLRLRGILKRAEGDRLTASVDHLLKSVQRTAFAIVQGLRRRRPGVKEGANPAIATVESSPNGTFDASSAKMARHLDSDSSANGISSPSDLESDETKSQTTSTS